MKVFFIGPMKIGGVSTINKEVQRIVRIYSDENNLFAKFEDILHLVCKKLFSKMKPNKVENIQSFYSNYFFS
ncbi:unnamed protein product, partial [marine sediment metagenome]